MANEILPIPSSYAVTTTSLIMPAGAQNGYVLTTDSNGVSSWQAPAAGGVSNPMKLGTPSTLLNVPARIKKVEQYGSYWAAIGDIDDYILYSSSPFEPTKWESSKEMRFCTGLTSTTSLGFVCVDELGMLYTSPDGAVWTFLKKFDVDVRDIIGIGDTLLVVGAMITIEGFQYPSVWTTTTGSSWTFHVVDVGGEITKLKKIGNTIIGLGEFGLFFTLTLPDLSDIHISRADENEAVTPKDVVYDAVEQVYTVIGDGWFVRSDPGDQDVWP